MTIPTHRRLRIVAVLTTLATAAPLAAASAQAAAAKSAACTARFTATIAPGFTQTASSGTLTSHGQTGSITCVGTVGGHRVTGPGSFGVEQAHSGATCRSLVGTGTVRISIPTAAGVKHMVGDLAVRRTALVVRAEARFPGARLSVAGAAIPRQGNCFITPLRQVSVSVTGVLRAAP